MNVTELFGQIDVVGVVMLTVGATAELMVMVTEFEVAVAGTAHDALDVIVQVTIWPLVSVVVV